MTTVKMKIAKYKRYCQRCEEKRILKSALEDVNS